MLAAACGKIDPADWQPEKVKLYNEDEDGRPLRWSNSPSMSFYELVLRRQTIEAIPDLLSQAGCTLLRLDCNETALALVKPRIVDALDEARTIFKRYPGSKDIMYVVEYAFLPQRVASELIFKVPQKDILATFVTDRFITGWQAAGMRGTDFLLAWEG